MAHLLDECLKQIVKNFEISANKYEAHLKCYPILNRMAANDEVIFEVFRRNMLKPKFFNKKRCTPDFQLTLLDEPEVFLFVNFFGPNKEKRTDYSYSTMHHHDDFLLSTINAKGKGYTSLIFKQGYEIDKDNMTAKLDLEKFVLHQPGNIEFIDCHTAHALFYPESTTMTYGLWSTHFPTPQSAKWKKNPIIQKNKTWIKKAINAVKFDVKTVGVAQYREDYFYPKDGELKFLPGQVLPQDGDYFVQNFFNIAQEFLQFSDFEFLKNLYEKIKKGDIPNEQPPTLEWIEKTIEKEVIERNYDSYNMYTPKRNVHIDEYQRIYNFLEADTSIAQ